MEPANSCSSLIGAALLFLTSAAAPALASEPWLPQQDEAASAQPESGEATRDRWTLAFGAGLLSTSDAPAGAFSFDHGLFGSEQGEFDADYAGGEASLYEISIGRRLRGRLGLALTWSQSSLSDKADIAGRLPHPFLFETPRTVEGTADGLSRDETALHLSLKWFLRDGERLQVAVFGGPSQIDLEYELASAVLFDQTYPFDTASYSGVERRQEAGSAAGYHVGIDVVRYFGKRTGIGGLLRFHDASIDLDAPDGGSVSVDSGGLQAVVDFRIRF